MFLVIALLSCVSQGFTICSIVSHFGKLFLIYSLVLVIRAAGASALTDRTHAESLPLLFLLV